MRSRPLLACHPRQRPRNRSFPNRCPPRRRRCHCHWRGRRRSSRKNRKRTRTACCKRPARAQAPAGAHGPRRAETSEPVPQPVDWIAPAPEPVHETPAWPKRVERPKSAPVKFLVEPEQAPSPAVERQIDRAVAAALARRQAPLLHWLVAGLSFVCLVESLIIGGLLASRATTASASGPGRTPVAPAAQATTPVSPPATAPVASAATPRPRPPRPHRPEVAM